MVPLAAIQAVPIAVIAWYRLHRYAWYRYSAIVTVRKKTGVSKKGFSEAKADLSIAVLSAITYNPAIRDYWIRKKKEKCGGIVLNAIKFKLVLRMFAVIKRGTPYVETDAYKN